MSQDSENLSGRAEFARPARETCCNLPQLTDSQQPLQAELERRGRLMRLDDQAMEFEVRVAALNVGELASKNSRRRRTAGLKRKLPHRPVIIKHLNQGSERTARAEGIEQKGCDRPGHGLGWQSQRDPRYCATASSCACRGSRQVVQPQKATVTLLPEAPFDLAWDGGFGINQGEAIDVGEVINRQLVHSTFFRFGGVAIAGAIPVQ